MSNDGSGVWGVQSGVNDGSNVQQWKWDVVDLPVATFSQRSTGKKNSNFATQYNNLYTAGACSGALTNEILITSCMLAQFLSQSSI